MDLSARGSSRWTPSVWTLAWVSQTHVFIVKLKVIYSILPLLDFVLLCTAVNKPIFYFDIFGSKNLLVTRNSFVIVIKIRDSYFS